MKKPTQTQCLCGFMRSEWRRRWDSNPRALADNRISRGNFANFSSVSFYMF